MNKNRMMVCVGVVCSILLGLQSPEVEALNDGPPLSVYYCYHVAYGSQDPFFYAMVGPTQPCPDPPPLPGYTRHTEPEHDCQVVREGGNSV